MPSHRDPQGQDVRSRLERAAWLEALARAVQQGRYQPHPGAIAEALARAGWPDVDAAPRRRRR